MLKKSWQKIFSLNSRIISLLILFLINICNFKRPMNTKKTCQSLHLNNQMKPWCLFLKDLINKFQGNFRLCILPENLLSTLWTQSWSVYTSNRQWTMTWEEWVFCLPAMGLWGFLHGKTGTSTGNLKLQELKNKIKINLSDEPEYQV